MGLRVVRQNHLTAAATRVTDPAKTFRSKVGLGRGGTNWQTEAWDFLAEIGELADWADWVASAVSRCRLVAVDVDPDTGEPGDPTDNTTVSQIVRDIGGGHTGRTQMLYRLGLFLSVPGEGWIAMITQDGQAEWVALSRDEINATNKGVEVSMPDGQKHQYDPGTDLLFRVWNQDPRKAAEATSPVKASRTALWEIRRATTRIDNASRSRAVGNGILFMPSEINLPAAGDDPNRNSAERMQDLIYQVATTATNDPDSMAAFLPIMATGSSGHIQKVNHIKFDSDVSKTALDTRDRAIRRLSMSLKVSPERMLGLGQTNHWNAEAIDQNDVRTHISPVLETVCDALTTSVLQPLLEQAGIDSGRFMVWYDATPISQDPDKGEEATAAYDRGVITAQALRGYLGMEESDAPDPDSPDAARDLAIKLVTGAPSLLPMLAPVIGIDIAEVDDVSAVE